MRHYEIVFFHGMIPISLSYDSIKQTVRHLFPVLNAKERIKKGEIKPSDVPYEQRQGSYDNSDVNVGYVPSGMSVHEWHELQRLERRELKAKEFGKIGPKGFMSRSLQAFQEDLAKGKVRMSISLKPDCKHRHLNLLLFWDFDICLIRLNIYFPFPPEG